MLMRAMWMAGSLAAGLCMGCDGITAKLVPEASAPWGVDAGPDSAATTGRAADVETASPDGIPSPDLPGPDLALESLSADAALPAADAVLAVDTGTFDVDQVSPSGVDSSAYDAGQDSPLVSGADGALDSGMDGAGEAAGADCPSGTPYVVLLSGFGDGDLYRFQPDSRALARIATVSCGSPAKELNSLAASALGPIYVSNLVGDLCLVEPSTFAISSTSFDAVAVANRPYGMALLPEPAAAGQLLYLALRTAGQADQLARVDLATFARTVVGSIRLEHDASTKAYSDVELTGGSRGRLYGFAATAMPPVLLTVDPRTGNATVMAEVPVGMPGGFGLVEWQGLLYLFFAEAGNRRSTVYTCRDGDAQVSLIGTIDVAVIGAGVTVCP
jgi:hypothetical protein